MNKPGFKNSLQWVGLIPGITIIAVIILVRALGFLQGGEWSNLDLYLHLRPPEAIDSRITIIGINEADIQSLQQYPLSDLEIATLIKKLKQYQPRAIGLDIIRDIPVEPGHDLLIETFQTTPHLIGIQKVLGAEIAPPPALPAAQVGISDVLPDEDGRVRRSLLGTYSQDRERYYFSFALRLAEVYLSLEDKTLKNGQQDPETMAWDQVEIPRFLPYTGGYINADSGGLQTLLNYRNNPHSFPTFSLTDLKSGNIPLEHLQNQLILIGITTPSAPDLVYSNAVADSLVKGEIYGVEFHAHAISQILSAVLDHRPLLRSLGEGWEYGWIILWGLGGIYLSKLTLLPLKNLGAILGASGILICVGYFSLWGGWWLPILPAVSALVLNGVVLTSFYLSYRSLWFQLAARQQTIEETFTIIHNGPLQTLAAMLKKARNSEDSEFIAYLESLNREIRDIGEYLKRESLNPSDCLRLGSGLILDLRCPLHDLLYQVFSSTLERDLPCFITLKAKVRSFEPTSRELPFTQKRELCQFFEEALCNIGKHAQGVIRVQATGVERQGWYILSIQDNGIGKPMISEGLGTQQAKILARRLGGQFRRKKLRYKGTLCELTWPIVTPKLATIKAIIWSILTKFRLRKFLNFR